MQNYNAVVADILATQFTSPVVSAADEETGKAQLTRIAAYEIWRTNPNIGLVAKDSGNQVAGMTVDVLMDRTDGSAADCASSTPDAPGLVRITTPWSAYGVNTDPTWLTRWRQPTAALAALPGPMPLVSPGPGPTPPTPPADHTEILAKLDDILATLAVMQAQADLNTETIVLRDDANTEKIQVQLHQIVENAEETLKEVLVLLLANRTPEEDLEAEQLVASLVDRIRERRHADGR